MKTLKYGLVALLVTGLCWAATVGAWRYFAITPGTLAIVLWLVLLPLVILVGLLLLSRQSQARHGQTDVSKQRPDEAEPIDPVFTHEVLVLDWRGATRQGNDCAAILTSIKEAAVVELDPELRGPQDQPLLSGRIDSTTEIADALRMRMMDESVDIASIDEAVLRAAALLGKVAGPLLIQAKSFIENRLAPLRQAPDGSDGLPAASLRVLVQVPQEWSEAEKSLIRNETSWHAAEVGIDDVNIKIVDAPLAAILEQAYAVPEEGKLEHAAYIGPLLLLACDSRLSVHAISALAQHNRLYQSQHSRGWTPADSVAGLLVVHPAQKDWRRLSAAQPELLGHAVTLGYTTPRTTPNELPTEHQTDDRRQPSADAIIEALLSASCVRYEDIAHLVSTAGLDRGALTPVLKLLDQFPTLDMETDVSMIEPGAGTLGATAHLLAAALAAEQAHILRRPVLFHSHLNDMTSAGLATPMITAQTDVAAR